VLFISVPCQWDLNRDFVYPSCSIIQENIIFNSANDRSNLKFDIVLDIGTWESPFPFWASAQVTGPRRSSNEAQNKQSHEAQSDSTMCYVAHARKEKCHGWPRNFPRSNCPDILCSTRQTRLSSFLVPPPFENLGTIFLLRGEGCNTPCYGYLLITFIRSLIMHQVH
jgi:hypothetical protein